jgi:hypothetical protein
LFNDFGKKTMLGGDHMGGVGSGRKYYHDAKDTVDSCNSIDIHCLKKNRALVPGHSLTLTWSKNGRKQASIGGKVTEEGLNLFYRINGESIRYVVPIVHTSCHYGGTRPWLKCPKCDRRVSKIHLNGTMFLCRYCYNLAYESQRTNNVIRSLRKAKMIRMRLGGSMSIFESMPWKPKGMHMKTYWRIRQEIEITELKMWEGLAKLVRF